jgi:hypothetical protein
VIDEASADSECVGQQDPVTWVELDDNNLPHVVVVADEKSKVPRFYAASSLARSGGRDPLTNMPFTPEQLSNILASVGPSDLRHASETDEEDSEYVLVDTDADSDVEEFFGALPPEARESVVGFCNSHRCTRHLLSPSILEDAELLHGIAGAF